jgi:hypothetical protein
MVFQMLLKMFTLKDVQTIHRSTLDSLYVFKCKRFDNTRHRVTFGLSLQSSFWNTLHYQWKSHWTITIPSETQCVFLHYDSSGHCTCPLNKFIQAYKVAKLFLKYPVLFCIVSSCNVILRDRIPILATRFRSGLWMHRVSYWMSIWDSLRLPFLRMQRALSPLDVVVGFSQPSSHVFFIYFFFRVYLVLR